MPKAKMEDSLSTSAAQESSDATAQTYAQLPPLPPSPLDTESSVFPELLTSTNVYALDQKAAALQQQEADLTAQRMRLTQQDAYLKFQGIELAQREANLNRQCMELAQREAQTKEWDARLKCWASVQEQRINEHWQQLTVWTERLRHQEHRILNDTEKLKQQKTELDTTIILLSNTIKSIQEGSPEEGKRKRDDEDPSVQSTSRARFLSPPAPSAFSIPAENRNPQQGPKIP